MKQAEQPPAAGIGRCSILVDGRGLYASGIGRYLRQVLGRLLVDERFHSVTLFGSRDELQAFLDRCGRPKHVQVHGYAGSFYSAASQLDWIRLRALGHTETDLAFFPHFDVPLVAYPERSVVTIHDLTHFKVPTAFPRRHQRSAGFMLERVVRRATRLIVVSENTRNDLVARIPDAAAKVEVVPNGIGDEFLECSRGNSKVWDWARSLRPFLLCVGNRKPHKNQVAAVDVLERLHRERGLSALRLVVVGRKFRGGDTVQARAEQLGIGSAVIELENVDDAALAALYANCEAFLFPSLYEGFGLPVLEAMACGAPVIASDRSSIPEVAGSAAILLDPHDHRGMAEAVLRLRSQPGLRERLVSAGRQRAACFSWSRPVERTLDLFYRTARADSVPIGELCASTGG